MKKLYVFAGVLLLAFSPVAAQNADSVRFRRADGTPVTIETVDRDSLGIDTLRRIDTVDNGLVTLRDGGRDGSMVLEVAGFGLRLGHTPMQKMEVKSPRVWLNLLSDMEFGFTQLTGVDYSGYAPGAGRSASASACNTRSTTFALPIRESPLATSADASCR